MPRPTLAYSTSRRLVRPRSVAAGVVLGVLVIVFVVLCITTDPFTHHYRLFRARRLRNDLRVLERCIEQLLARSGVDSSAVDTVFLTGGSSFVPAVRAIFSRMFPGATISGGSELTSVATGLALRARSIERARL